MQRYSLDVQLHPITLAFQGPRRESAFRAQQYATWASHDPQYQTWNVVVAIFNCGVSAYLATGGNMLTRKFAALVLPYLIVAVVHRVAVTRPAYHRHRQLAVLTFEMLYVIICTLSMPHWVIVGHVADMRSWVRTFVLGSGVMISYWFTFLHNKLWETDMLAIPAHFTLQTAFLTRVTCDSLEGGPEGRRLAEALLQQLDAMAMLQAPCYPMRSCTNIMVAWQLLWCVLLLYVRWRMERSKRRAFADDSAPPSTWPAMPLSVQAVLHVVVGLKLFAAVWIALQCVQQAMPWAA